MANGNVSIEGIEFDLKANVDESSASAIRSLASSLSRLQDVLGRGIDTKKSVNAVTNLMNAVNSVSTLRADGLTMLVRSLSSLSRVKTPENLDKAASSVNTIVTATQAITPELADSVYKYAQALAVLAQVRTGGIGSAIANGQSAIDKAKMASQPYFTNSFGYDTRYSSKTVYGTYTPGKDTMVDENGNPIEPSEIQAAEAVARTYEEDAEAAKHLKEETAQLAAEQQKLANVMGEDIYKRAKAFMSGFGNAVKKTTGLMESFLGYTKDLAGGIWGKLTSGIRGAVAQFENLRRSFGRILLYRVIRTLIKDIGAAFQTGIGDLYQYSTLMGGTFATSMDTIATSMLYLKNSMATMAAPLINAVAPAIDYLIDKVVELMNVIAQAMATLTGAGTWDKALKYPTKYAAAADDANNSAKELQKTVMGFDELNRLNDNNKGSSGSGANALDYSSMFTTESVSNSIKDMMGVKDWSSVGKTIADNLNTGMKKVDEWIKNKFSPMAQTWATRMGTMLSGFVKGFDWSQLGITFGDGLNSIISAMNTFYEKAGNSFYLIGAGIAQSINSFFTTVNWDDVGLYLSNKLNKFIDIFSGFFTELSKGAYTNGFNLGVMLKNFFINIDWSSIRVGLKAMLKTVADTLEGFITGTDGSFDGFTDEFANTINSFFANPDLDRILKSIGDIINSIVIGLGKLDWRQIGVAVGKALGAIDWNNVLQTFVDALEGMMGGFFEGMFNSEHGSTTLLLMTAIGGLGGAFSVGHILTDALLKQLAIDIGAKLVGSAGLGSLTTAGGTTMTALSGLGATLGMGLLAGFDIALVAWDVKQYISMADQYATLAQSQAVAKASETTAELKIQSELLKNNIVASVDDISKALDDGVSIADIQSGNFEGAMKKASDSTATAADSIKSSMSDAELATDENWGNMSETAKQKLSEMQLNADGTFSSISDKVKDELETATKENDDNWISMSDTAKAKLDKMNTDTSTSYSSISSTMSEKLNQMKTDSNTKFEELANGYTDKLDDMKTSGSGKMQALKTSFGGDVDDLKKKLDFSWKLPDVGSSYFPSLHVSGSLNPLDWLENGELPSFRWYANGGFPEDGLFMANHGEMVGQFSNGRTAVANNEQIVAGIQQGVYTAMMAAMSDGNSNSDSTPQVNVFIGNEQLDSYVASSNKRMALASGGR